MANKQVGEHSFQADGSKWTLRFGAWAISELETELDRSILSIAKELENPEAVRTRTVIACVWAGLQQHHPEIDMRTAADLMDKRGLEAVRIDLETAINLAFPEGEGGGSDANPPAGNRQQRRAAKAKAGKGSTG